MISSSLFGIISKYIKEGTFKLIKVNSLSFPAHFSNTLSFLTIKKQPSWLLCHLKCSMQNGLSNLCNTFLLSKSSIIKTFAEVITANQFPLLANFNPLIFSPKSITFHDSLASLLMNTSLLSSVVQVYFVFAAMLKIIVLLISERIYGSGISIYSLYKYSIFIQNLLNYSQFYSNNSGLTI